MLEVDHDEGYPFWRFVTKIEKVGKGGGNYKFRCNHCHKEYSGSHTRARAHLLSIKGAGIAPCGNVTSQNIIEFKRVEEEAKARGQASHSKKVRLPPQMPSFIVGSSMYSQQDFFSKKRKTSDGDNPLESANNMAARAQLDAIIARMYYTGGIPFHFAKNPNYILSYTFLANHNLSGYIPPGCNSLRTTLLKNERKNVENLLELIKSTWPEKGATIVSDGWSDSQRRPIINFMVVSDSQPMFIKAIDCLEEVKDKYFIANLLKEVIMEVGSRNVVQVITDNAPNCKAAGQLIEAQFPNIVWTPCVVHTLNLALKNICAAKHVEQNEITYDACSWITEIVGDVIIIKSFIMNHGMRLAMFNEFVPLKLLSVAETRFASSIVMLKRFKMIKQGLRTMVISDSWNLYQDDDRGKARFVKDKVLDDIFWDKIDYILAFTGPIYDMLRFCNTDKPCLHLVYDMWDCMIEKVKKSIYRYEGKQSGEESTFYEVVHAILVDRWNKNNTPLYCLAHSLNPRYYTEQWLQEDPSRIAPHRDMEITLERNKCLKRYFENGVERNQVMTECAMFSTKSGYFADTDSIDAMWSMEPHSWWAVYGTYAPKLQALALKVPKQPASSSCSERNWSNYSFIHSVMRNKMTPQRAEDLVFVHSNLRLLSRKDPEYTTGRSKLWDIAGDEFDMLDDVGLLGVASLSLDEPELESVLFTNDGDEEENE